MIDSLHTLRRAIWHFRQGSLLHFIQREREKAGKSNAGKRGLVSDILPTLSHHQLRPAQAHAVEAKKLLAEGNFKEALEKAELAVSIEPALMKAHYDRIRILARMGSMEQATALAIELTDKFPMDVGLIRAAQSVGYHPQPLPADAIYEIFGAAKDRLTAALKAMEYYYFFGRFSDALNFYDIGKTVAHRVTKQASRERLLERLENGRALSLEGLNEYNRALESHRSIVTTAPKPLQAAAGMARCLLELESPHEAYRVLKAPTDKPLDPPGFSPLMMDILQASDRISESYALYRQRPVSRAIAEQFGMPDPAQINISNGQYRDKKVVLISEGGPGDEMRFSSLYGELREYFSDITITCDPRMKASLERSFPAITFLPADRWRRDIEKSVPNRNRVTNPTIYQCVTDDVIEAAQGADLVCSILDLLTELRADRDAFRRKPRSLLSPDPALAADWKDRLGSHPLKIGIAWRSMLRSVARDRHYLQAEDLHILSRLKGAQFWSLQPKVTDEELEEARQHIDLQVPRGLDLVDDIEGQLALCSHLDFILAPFNTTGETGGALGVPTFLLATTGNTIWRRNRDGSDLFSERTTIVRGHPLHDKRACLAEAVTAISRSL